MDTETDEKRPARGVAIPRDVYDKMVEHVRPTGRTLTFFVARAIEAAIQAEIEECAARVAALAKEEEAPARATA